MLRHWLIFIGVLVAAAWTAYAIVASGRFECHGEAWLIQLLLFVVFAHGAVLVIRFRETWPAARVASLVLTSLVVIVISSTRPMRIDETEFPAKPVPVSGASTKLIEMELQKANDEILLRVGQEDTWFHYKFIFVGAMLAAFGSVFTFRRKKLDVELAVIIQSPTTCTLLALACVVALSIDIHLRNNIIVIQQLGLWVARYAEPALMPAAATTYLPWEQFLRTGGGMHSDSLYGFAFYPHLHFLTWAVYASYLACFHAIAVRASKSADRRQPYALLTGGFVAVHAAFAVFAWVGHFVPGALETNMIPFGDECWRTGASAAFGYLLLALLLVVLNWPFAWQFARRAMKALALVLGASLLAAHAQAGEREAVRYLAEALDRYHRTYDVYTDHGAAGNHFYEREQMGEVPSMEETFAGCTDAGATCIRATFDSKIDRGVPNWGGWFFRGASPVDLTGAKRLSFRARGETGRERIEFLALDGAAKVVKPVKLEREWQTHTIELGERDRSHVKGGFGWVAAATANGMRDVVFYLDDVRYELDRRDEARFMVSFETAGNSDFDRVNRNAAHTYDNALALLAFVAAGDTRRAKLLGDAFVAAQAHDRFTPANDVYRGALRNAYQGGDLFVADGPRAGSVRLPGWYEEGKWLEDAYAVSLDTGNMAWAMLALIALHRAVPSDGRYLDAAITLGEWIERNCATDLGYDGGYNGREPSPKKADYRSTEHNIDLYAAFEHLAQITRAPRWHDRAERARKFVMKMWDEKRGLFWTGMEGEAINRIVVPLDVQAWAVLSLRDALPAAIGQRALAYVDTHMKLDGGYDYSRRACIDNASHCDDRRGVWYEGTAQMALAQRQLGNANQARAIVALIARRQLQSGAIPASDQKEGLPTGFVRDDIVLKYYDRPHVGATAWYVFAERGVNPYWVGSRQ